MVEPMNISYICTLFHLNFLIYTIFFALLRFSPPREAPADMKSDELYHVSEKKKEKKKQKEKEKNNREPDCA